jgi:CheY-like chemotaxis protein
VGGPFFAALKQVMAHLGAWRRPFSESRLVRARTSQSRLGSCTVSHFGPCEPLVVTMKRRILIVDDERVIADTLAAILGSTSEVHVAYSGRQALEIAGLIKPDLLLTDVVMPDTNGIEVARRVSDALPTCKILLFSGSITAADLKARCCEKWEILSKPLDPRDLLLRVNDFTGTKQIWSEPESPRATSGEGRSSAVSKRSPASP